MKQTLTEIRDSIVSNAMIEVSIPCDDQKIIKELAKKVANHAASQIQDERKKLWTLHNDLKPTRPLIFCDPENGWNEILPEKDLNCTSPLGRDFENILLKEIFWAEKMNDDRVIEPVFYLPVVCEDIHWGLKPKRIGGEDDGAYHWEAPIKDYAQIKDLTAPKLVIHKETTEKLLSLAKEIFDGILDVRIGYEIQHTVSPTLIFTNLRGLEPFLYDMYDYPEEVHELMAFITNGLDNLLVEIEAQKALFANTGGCYVGSGGFGWTDELPKPTHNPVRLVENWGFCESQESNTISTKMYQEFIFPYEKKLLARFGLVNYGCCEPLDTRWDVVKGFERLRRCSVSAWADYAKMADFLKNDYVFSYKPSPTHLAMPTIDEDYLKSSLRDFVNATKNCCVEIVMKDNHTLGNNPENAVKWCAIAKEAAMRV